MRILYSATIVQPRDDTSIAELEAYQNNVGLLDGLLDSTCYRYRS
jgi:hypothetical protein